MKVKELLNLIPQETWDRLTIETKVNHKAKKLDGRVVFTLLLYSLIYSKENSLRVMEKIFNSYLFQTLHPEPIATNVRHSSLGQRLGSIKADFFEKLYYDCLHMYSSDLNEKENKILRFDSTIVSISAKLVDIGFICGGGHDNSRQIKFTMGFSEVTEYARLYHESSANSDNVALKNAILDCKISEDRIVLFDRGIQSRDTYDEFMEKGILFITRINPKPRCKQQTQNVISSPTEADGLVIDEDSKKKLINRDGKITKHAFRYIHSVNKETKKPIAFLTNIEALSAADIAATYKRRWDIEVFFKFLKQELHFSHLLSRNENGIKVVLYTTLILSILLTVYKKRNKLKGYKIPKLQFALEMEEELIKYIIQLHGGDINNPNTQYPPFWNTT